MDKLKKVIKGLEMSYTFSNVDEDNTLVPQQLVLDALALLKAQEPVVRCRDCKYYAINRLTKAYEPDKRFNPSVCIIGEFARPRKPDWFCADGERRDSE